MVREIFVRQGSVLKPVTAGNIWVKTRGDLRPVVGVWVKQLGVLQKYWDYVPLIPASFRVTAQDFTSATFAWGAVTGAEQYQVLSREGNAKFSDPITNQGKVSKDRLSLKVTGLKRNTTYIFTVRAINKFWGVDIEGPESNARKIYTGVPPVLEKGNSDGFKPFQPNRADTYTKQHNWSGNKNSGKVAQGTYDQSNADNRNQYGCVDYSTIYNTLRSRHGTFDYVRGDPPKTTVRYIADFIHVIAAKIDTISRPKSSGGGASPDLRFNNGSFSMGSNKVPAMPGDAKALQAPKEGESKQDIEINAVWADQWIRPPGRPANGIVVFRGDGNQYCVLSGVGDGKAWDLLLRYDWEIIATPEKPHTNAAYTFPGGTVLT